VNKDTFKKPNDLLYQHYCSPAQIERDFQNLIGLISGITSDGVINDKEMFTLVNWIFETKQYENRQPYKELVNIVGKAISDYYLSEEEIENIIWFCNQYISQNSYYDILTCGIQRLSGILHGISADNEINELEIQFLKQWIEDNAPLKAIYPFDEIYSVVYSLFDAKIWKEQESKLLLKYCKAFSNVDQTSDTKELMQIVNLGICQSSPIIMVEGNTFCLTGESKLYSRKQIENHIYLNGGIVKNTVSFKLNYLIICEEKSSCWAFACYGRKIEKAIELRKQGALINIIHESDLFNTIEPMV